MQTVTLAQSTAGGTDLTPGNASITWKPQEYMDHWISWSNLGSAVATIRIFSLAGAAESEFQIHDVTYTLDNKGVFFPYETYGPIYGFAIVYTVATFTGNVFFASARPSTGIV